ncbi:hypothetical protein EDE15_0115 [Edaphobacter aggregans]|uniref:Uncharacterized protein n=1 Tax=Edaphobacter aggregans TaxID=570835 RepID=A0A3R9QE73_9BACT|nr:hypothetical protein EDE15_0115 [Edaphobacter aggregans]
MVALAILVGFLILFASFFFWLGWKWRANVEERRRYRESHPKYMHSGGSREAS